jgi:hypothetical protein
LGKPILDLIHIALDRISGANKGKWNTTEAGDENEPPESIVEGFLTRLAVPH